MEAEGHAWRRADDGESGKVKGGWSTAGIAGWISRRLSLPVS